MSAKSATQTRYIVQPYVLDRKSKLSASPAHVYETQFAAERRAERLMEKNTAIGVLVILEAGVPEQDEYEDPVVVFRVGRVPEE